MYRYRTMNYEQLRKIKTREDNAKIYIIKSFNSDKYYIGSSYQMLSKVLWTEKNKFGNYHKNGKYLSVFEVLRHKDCYIEELENCSGMDGRKVVSRKNELLAEHKKTGNLVNFIKFQDLTETSKLDLKNSSKT